MVERDRWYEKFPRGPRSKAPQHGLQVVPEPRLGEMLGEDDGLQKTTPAGRDYLRLEHMRQLHAFTRRKTKVSLGEREAAAA